LEIVAKLIIDLPSYVVAPLDSIGPVKLGMTRNQARLAMNLPYETFQKSPYHASLTDAFHESGFQVSYYKSDLVEYIELSCGAVNALYKGVSVFETKAEEMVAWGGPIFADTNVA
jgi:hypothetical protein